MVNQVIFFLLNGAGALILETVWLKKQISIFGSSPESYGSILFAYFLGISAGSLFYRRKRGGGPSPIKLYAGFVAALLFSLCLPILLDRLQLPASFVYGQPLLYKSLLWMLAIVSIFPACFFLGGFFPLIAETVSRRNFVSLYGVQALGAFLGVYFGSFLLPYTVGYLITFFIGIIINIASLYFLNRILLHRVAAFQQRSEKMQALRPVVYAFLSGFLSLILQVLWIRFIAMGTDNSIYAFGSATLIILLQLALASYITSRLPAAWFRMPFLLPGLLLLSVVGIIISSELYLWLTDDLSIDAIRNATGLVSSLGFAASFMCVGYFFPSFLFPFIMRSAESDAGHEGARGIGLLIAANGVGCAVGSVLTSFALLPWLGFRTTLLIALTGYLVFMLSAGTARSRFFAAAAGAALILAINPLNYPLVTPVDPYGGIASGSVVWAKEGKYGIVSVIDYPNRARTLWLNNTYQLEAGMSDVTGPYRLGLFPTVLNPAAKSLAMIGIGTGISSNGFLNSRIERITLVEMIPEVAEAAAVYFPMFNGNVLANPRVETIIDDGRHYLKTGSRTFDIINSDVFTPWNEGTAYLYTVDHFRNVRKRLGSNGLFCLWLPMFQITREEFLIIAKSFASVFPHTTVWQLGSGIDESAVALVGTERIDTEAIRAYTQDLPFPRLRPDIIQVHESGIFSNYLGPVVLTDALWHGVPVNTLDHPVIEFRAAQSGRILLQGKELLDLFEVFLRLPGNPGQDFFTQYDARMDEYRLAGWHLNLSSYYAQLGDFSSAIRFSAGAASLPALSMYKRSLEIPELKD